MDDKAMKGGKARENLRTQILLALKGIPNLSQCRDEAHRRQPSINGETWKGFSKWPFYHSLSLSLSCFWCLVGEALPGFMIFWRCETSKEGAHSFLEDRQSRGFKVAASPENSYAPISRGKRNFNGTWRPR